MELCLRYNLCIFLLFPFSPCCPKKGQEKYFVCIFFAPGSSLRKREFPEDNTYMPIGLKKKENWRIHFSWNKCTITKEVCWLANSRRNNVFKPIYYLENVRSSCDLDFWLWAFLRSIFVFQISVYQQTLTFCGMIPTWIDYRSPQGYTWFHFSSEEKYPRIILLWGLQLLFFHSQT